ncbi:MAG TPA: hypothetical protein VHT53_13800 [Candidatus Elarobacter sp.]|jgi:hypothetical protein|nr:hypothetical protein [Candidatus Elarobacter sp.]
MTPGLAKLMDEVATAALPGLADDLWRLVYTRGYVDVERARPSLDGDYGGILVYAHAVDAVRALLVVDTGDRLVGAVATVGAAPRPGSAVRLTSTPTSRKAAWRLVIDEAFPAILDVRFDRVAAGSSDVRWVTAVRDALGAVRATEAVRREGIAARRRRLPPYAEPPSSEGVVRGHVDALRLQVERDTGFTSDELSELDAVRFARTAGTYAEQRRAFERETAIVQARQARFDERMRAELAAFRERLPELHRRIRERRLANEAVRSELQRLEDAHIESCARTQAAHAASRMLDALAAGPFLATLREPFALEDPACGQDVIRTVALLSRALPRSAVRIAV